MLLEKFILGYFLLKRKLYFSDLILSIWVKNKFVSIFYFILILCFIYSKFYILYYLSGNLE